MPPVSNGLTPVIGCCVVTVDGETERRRFDVVVVVSAGTSSHPLPQHRPTRRLRSGMWHIYRLLLQELVHKQECSTTSSTQWRHGRVEARGSCSLYFGLSKIAGKSDFSLKMLNLRGRNPILVKFRSKIRILSTIICLVSNFQLSVGILSEICSHLSLAACNSFIVKLTKFYKIVLRRVSGVMGSLIFFLLQ